MSCSDPQDAYPASAADPAFAFQRRRMVNEQIRQRGITHSRLLAVMEEVPRERFLPAGAAQYAFDDAAVALSMGQTISQPFMVALMTARLDPQPHQRILEIGTGSGYQTAVLARMAADVYTIDRLGPLQEAAKGVLDALGFTNIHYRVGDGSVGWREAAPFDGIIVTAAAPQIPAPLLDQLADHGRLVVPVGGKDEQVLTIVERRGERIVETHSTHCRFVKLIGDAGWPENIAQ